MSTAVKHDQAADFLPAPELQERLNLLAEETNQPVSFYINDMLNKYLDDLEAACRIQKEARDIRAGKVKTRPLREVLAEMGL